MDIGIVGLGLIGGCLGLDFKALGHRVYGVARRSETCTQALSRQMVDTASSDFAALRPCEVVFICTPIATLVPVVADLAQVLAPGTIVTDVGSVKAAVVDKATRHWPQFVGGHPMSGKSEAGLEAAEPGIFRDRPYVITPLPQTDPTAIKTVEQLAQQLGSQLYRCSPAAHDRAVAWISHLPVMVSASLISAALQEPDPAVLTLAQQLASSGFRDTSRVGGGNPELGLMMAQYNRDAVLRSLRQYQQAIATTLTQIEAQDWPALSQQLQAAHQARPHFVPD
ncbi:prephenate/arogenate dehydrogenase [Leptolyngbya sp. BC1307]|uniref:prephenate/arogenate dehydrogenase n=1 Tax=Leptolyngbya sp. BC1307 TaxID=2029589 RepID=UPI000EFC5EEC|nr:prephenate/arogenate dehydrogenase [Leptolyngbya sp. BC1307]